MSAPRVFVDASVWIAAAASRGGASAMVLSVFSAGLAHPVCSRTALREVEKNIKSKLGAEVLLRFYQGLVSLKLDLVEPTTAKEIAAQSQIIAAKDAESLASALRARVDVLLTLDRKHLFSRKVLDANLPFRIVTPGEFLRDQVQ